MARLSVKEYRSLLSPKVARFSAKRSRAAWFSGHLAFRDFLGRGAMVDIGMLLLRKWTLCSTNNAVCTKTKKVISWGRVYMHWKGGRRKATLSSMYSTWLFVLSSMNIPRVRWRCSWVQNLRGVRDYRVTNKNQVCSRLCRTSNT